MENKELPEELKKEVLKGGISLQSANGDMFVVAFDGVAYPVPSDWLDSSIDEESVPPTLVFKVKEQYKQYVDIVNIFN